MTSPLSVYMCVGCGGYACVNNSEGDHSARFAKKQTEKEEKGISERKRGKKKKIKSKHSHLETAHSSWTMNFLGLLARASSAACLHLLAK